MMSTLKEKLGFLYQPYALAIISIGYVLGELGHYMIGVTSKAVAIDLHYGDHACQLNTTDYYIADLPQPCSNANNSESLVLKPVLRLLLN